MPAIDRRWNMMKKKTILDSMSRVKVNGGWNVPIVLEEEGEGSWKYGGMWFKKLGIIEPGNKDKMASLLFDLSISGHGLHKIKIGKTKVRLEFQKCLLNDTNLDADTIDAVISTI